ncbi:hypothetical protein [Neoaquamicrobium sediminum]|uniref:hypothetical protein n=1 Tax=Neoaquamicrobium sediminum TaxID=1849104 RepID=UPI00156315BA|nr:hypothetical protein [Mesorhizobium sediminum]NRC52990.1 hypothetical protein [Mesorhizobium sediminum]
MTTTHQPIEPDLSYFGLEPLICDTHSIVDVLFGLIDQHFSVEPDEHHRYVLSEQEGARLFYLAGLAFSISKAAQEGFYVAHDNERKAQGKEAA